MTQEQLWKAIEAYRSAGGREEHWARCDHLDAALDDLFRGVSDAQGLPSVAISAQTTGESSGHPTTQTAAEPVACLVETAQGVMLWPISDYNEACTYCHDDEAPIPLYAAPQESKLREAAQVGLVALENLFRGGVAVWSLGGSHEPRQAIDKLRDALGVTK